VRLDEYPRPLRALGIVKGLIFAACLGVIGVYYLALGHTAGKLVGLAMLPGACGYGAALLWHLLRR